MRGRQAGLWCWRGPLEAIRLLKIDASVEKVFQLYVEVVGYGNTVGDGSIRFNQLEVPALGLCLLRLQTLALRFRDAA